MKKRFIHNWTVFLLNSRRERINYMIAKTTRLWGRRRWSCIGNAENVAATMEKFYTQVHIILLPRIHLLVSNLRQVFLLWIFLDVWFLLHRNDASWKLNVYIIIVFYIGWYPWLNWPLISLQPYPVLITHGQHYASRSNWSYQLSGLLNSLSASCRAGKSNLLTSCRSC